LKGLILSGRLRPAERLAESTLAKRFGVSRTPLREALMKLEEEGLVVGERNVGYSVAAFDVAGVCDLLRVREALDVCAAELACHRATEEDLARIAAILEQMAALNETAGSFPSDLARKLELGIHIHKVIAEVTRNESLLRVSEQIYQQLQLALWLEVLWIDLDGSDLDEHRAIAEAIIARDPSAAAAAAREHVQSSLRNMLKLEELMKHRRGLIRA
jgi:DNA-binding GntR family transcriptional regulator